MSERLQEIFNKIKQTFSKISLVQKIIAISIIIIFIGAFIFMINFSGSDPVVYLFDKPLEMEDYAKVTAALSKMNIEFNTKNDKYITIADEKTGSRVRMKLAQQDLLPNGTKGWDLFDMQKWTTTDFERNVNLRRSIVGEMEKHLKSLEWIENVTINLDMPKQSLYTAKAKAIQASVTIKPSPHSTEYLEDKKIIKGIEKIVAYGIDNLDRENIVISDQFGRTLNDFTEDDNLGHIKRAKEEIKIKNRLQEDYELRVKEAFTDVLTDDRFEIDVSIELNFDKESIKQKDVLPVTIVPDNPNTPYDDSKIVQSVPISEKVVNEHFKGPGFIPEGPPGVEPNVPPGYKENIDKFSEYNKDEQIINHSTGEKITESSKDAYDIDRIAVAVIVDGQWQKEYNDKGQPIFLSNSYKRVYIPYPQDNLKKLEETVKASINFKPSRGDLVSVKNIPFDRTKTFEVEDQKYRKQQNVKKTLVFSLVILLSLFVGTVFYRAVKREILRRRRLKEQELARKQQLMRESILRSAEEEMPEDQLSADEKERLELSEKANKMATENPEQVAKLLRTWLAEE